MMVPAASTDLDVGAHETPTAPLPTVDPSPSSKDRARVIGQKARGIVIVAIIVIVVSSWLVESPIASVWYSFRQEHLSSQFTSPGAPRAGSALAVLQAPTHSINLVVVQGDGAGTLRAAAGHQPSSPLPGTLGNSVIFGHRWAWGGPFSKLSSLRKGNALFLQRRARSGDLEPLYFEVISARTVPASDRRPYGPSDDHRLTLVTSAGSGRRFVVQAVSGDVGRLRAPTATTSGSTGGQAGTVDTSLIWFGTCAVLGVGVVLVARLRHRGRVVALVSTSFALGALLALILAGDALFRAPLS